MNSFLIGSPVEDVLTPSFLFEKRKKSFLLGSFTVLRTKNLVLKIFNPKLNNLSNF